MMRSAAKSIIRLLPRSVNHIGDCLMRALSNCNVNWVSSDVGDDRILLDHGVRVLRGNDHLARNP